MRQTPVSSSRYPPCWTGAMRIVQSGSAPTGFFRKSFRGFSAYLRGFRQKPPWGLQKWDIIHPYACVFINTAVTEGGALACASHNPLRLRKRNSESRGRLPHTGGLLRALREHAPWAFEKTKYRPTAGPSRKQRTRERRGGARRGGCSAYQQLTILNSYRPTGEKSSKGGVSMEDRDAKPAQGGTQAHGAVSRGAGAAHGRTAHHTLRDAELRLHIPRGDYVARLYQYVGLDLDDVLHDFEAKTETRKGGEAGERRSDVTERPQKRETRRRSPKPSGSHKPD
jgi:hypothetical protein